jgi:hypothetical protein
LFLLYLINLLILDCPEGFDDYGFETAPQWIHDCECDEGNNVAKCNFDGGDCCLENENDDSCSIFDMEYIDTLGSFCCQHLSWDATDCL